MSSSIQIVGVRDAGDDVGFVYSHNNPNGNEFLALGVPTSKGSAVASTIKYLADRTVKPGDRVESDGLQLKVLQVNPTEHAHILSKYMTRTDRNATRMIVKLVPRFCGSIEHWGGYPAAPSGKQEMVESIMDTWAGGVGMFIRSKDGNTMNCSFANLQEVSLDAALKHADDWKVDWVCDLSSAEIQYVKNNIPYFLGLAKIQREGISICPVCDCADEEVKKLLVCGGCKSTYYCCKAHQKQHWPEHKAKCARWRRAMLAEQEDVSRGGAAAS
jgi:hypothetical protein